MESKVKKKILVVDDSKPNLLILNSILKQDYVVLAARNGSEALERARLFTPDLILLDIIMPEMDGFEVVAQLKSSSETRDIPVIFITGLSEPDDITKGMSLGAVDYITKPFDAEDVRKRVQNHLS